MAIICTTGQISRKIIILLCVLSFGSSTCGQNEAIKYIFDCGDLASSEIPEHTAGANERLHFSCSEDEVVVATVCVALVKGETVETCIDHYSILDDEDIIKEIDKCLWSRSFCDINVGSLQVLTMGKKCGVLQNYNSISAYNTQCVPKDIVFDVCNATNPVISPDVAYIRSPGFPKNVFPPKNCNMTFHSSERKTFNFVLQHVQIDPESDHLTVIGLERDGTLSDNSSKTKRWNGYHNHLSASFDAYGFVIQFKHTKPYQDGFLLSYSVSDPPETPPTTQSTATVSPTATMTASMLQTSMFVHYICLCFIFVLTKLG